jgi:dolichol kinase
VILFISKRKKLLEGINKVERITYGSECFPIAVFLCFLVYKIYNNLLFFYLPISILAFADPAAALLGKNIKSAAITIGDKKKTIAGSIAFFVVALVCSYQSYLFAEYEINFITLLTIGVVTTFIELISKNGFDNLTIPASVITILIIQNLL